MITNLERGLTLLEKPLKLYDYSSLYSTFPEIAIAVNDLWDKVCEKRLEGAQEEMIENMNQLRNKLEWIVKTPNNSLSWAKYYIGIHGTHITYYQYPEIWIKKRRGNFRAGTYLNPLTARYFRLIPKSQYKQVFLEKQDSDGIEGIWFRTGEIRDEEKVIRWLERLLPEIEIRKKSADNSILKSRIRSYQISNSMNQDIMRNFFVGMWLSSRGGLLKEYYNDTK